MRTPTSVLAWMLPQDGTQPYTQRIETFSRSAEVPPPKRKHFFSEGLSRKDCRKALALWKDRFFSKVLFNQYARESTPHLTTRALPDVQPIRPEQWSDKDWENRYVIGDSDFHGFCSLADDKAIRFLLKVSGDLEHDGEWTYEDVGQLTYEDVDDDPKVLEEQQESFKKLLVHYLDIAPRVSRTPKPYQV